MERRNSSNRTTMWMTDKGDVKKPLGAEFEVFLNFRGPDTRQTFADCLYHFMDIAGIRVFRDDEEIRNGEAIVGELERAIKSSLICIPIFSRNYASSAWCLRELAIMVDCKAMILPVFFDVNPGDVKLRTELYHGALQKHEEKFGSDTVQRWKEALGKVARMKGWNIKDRGYHGELIRQIVAEVLNKLNNRDKNLPNHLVGIQDCVEEVMRLLDEGSPDVHYLVIHGMGGIGKTTLAKVVFNHIYCRFDGCSFLSDVREASKGGKVVQLQKQLLSEILNSKSVEISDSDAGINQIKRRFRYKKVLIVLDDLDEWDQLSKLAEKRDWFGQGSRIIITTRNTNFLPIEEENRENGVQTCFEEFKIYGMRELSHRHALRLFSSHAFRMDSPPHDYYHTSRDIIRKTGGLPLAVEVIGSSLCGKSISLWKATLKKLNLIPNQDVHHKLKISFEMLGDAQKEIFLDVACYFIGKEKIHPHYMWKAMDFYPKVEIYVLSRMSLIKVNGDRLLMHDLLRDLGREIVRQENKVLEKRSRLWSPKDALDVLQNRKGTENITALKLIGLPKEHDFTSEEFSWLPNLRLLELEGGNLIGDFKNLLSSLKWLSWCRCPLYLQAVNLRLQNLVVLKLSNSEIPENWNGWGPCLESHDLKTIHLMRCHLSTAPDFSTCLNLRILVFAEHCPESPQIGSSIGKLEHLKRLEIIAGGVHPSNLSGCPSFDLRVMPSEICCLKHLSSLKLEGQRIRELHPSIGDIVGLTCLSLVDCYRLRKLPDSIGKLTSLLVLNLFNTRIRNLPDSVGDLKRLEKLYMGCTRIRELPRSIGELESLLDLDLQFSAIIALPASIGYLKRLKRLNMACSKMRELPNSIGDLKRLKEMNLAYTHIRELPSSIGGLESLLYLCLYCTKITDLPASIGYLRRLKNLTTYGSKLRRLPKAICTLENLQRLTYHDRSNVDITWPPLLRDLDIFCDDPRSLPRLPLGLRSLELNGVKSPMELPLLPELRYLPELTLSRWGLREMEFKQLENLHRLEVSHCKSLVRLSGLSSLGKLKNLRITSCSQLIEIRNLEEMESLEELSIAMCSSIERLPDLSKLHKLRSLHVNDCNSLQGLPDLPNFLEELSIENWSSIGRLPDLSMLYKLRILNLLHCESLQRLPDIPNSCDLYVHACPKLGESREDFGFCCHCANSNPRLSLRRRRMIRWHLLVLMMDPLQTTTEKLREASPFTVRSVSYHSSDFLCWTLVPSLRY
ncbi:disease resistance protein RUN1-like [Rhodamnia argentea]|uniref:Disease resistance protein RUN1-like n=1 Tax=Rhodamnia argentea TaxID=178133 RepID=A0ABM3HAB1_9MYRT|nr:disease resistance protein RUN1-like [Rhodamnia argentea]